MPSFQHNRIRDKVLELATDTLESIAADLIDAEATLELHQDEETRLRDGIRKIADDFHPDCDADAPLALQEMRDALLDLVSA